MNLRHTSTLGLLAILAAFPLAIGHAPDRVIVTLSVYGLAATMYAAFALHFRSNDA